MTKGKKIKINNQIMFYNGAIPGDLPIQTKHVLVTSRRKVGTGAQDMVLGDLAFWRVVKDGRLDLFPFMSDRVEEMV